MIHSQTQPIRQKNRLKLLIQNKKLHQQVVKLQEQISLLIEKKAATTIMKQADPQIKKNKQQIFVQSKYIKNLQNKLQRLKASNAQVNFQYIRKEEDQLHYLTNELQSLLSQRQLIEKRKNDKLKTLQKNRPLGDFKNSQQLDLSNTKKSNRQMQSKIVALQREIRKFHEIKQLSKVQPVKGIENPQYQVAKIQHKIKDQLKKIKDLSEKWQPQLNSLDSQLLDLKNVLNSKKQILESLEKQQKSLQIKVSGLRDQNDKANIKQRLSKVPLLQEEKRVSYLLLKNSQKHHQLKKRLEKSEELKRSQQKIKITEKQKKIQLQKQKQAQQEQARKQQALKRLEANMIEVKERQHRSQTYSSHNKLQSRMEVRTQRKWILNKAVPHSQKNQFITSPPINTTQLQKIKQDQKKKKILKNVGVGTSFYYQD